MRELAESTGVAGVAIGFFLAVFLDFDGVAVLAEASWTGGKGTVESETVKECVVGLPGLVELLAKSSIGKVGKADIPLGTHPCHQFLPSTCFLGLTLYHAHLNKTLKRQENSKTNYIKRKKKTYEKENSLD
ncbi:hypothetical protein V6N12_052441 [Hibiscus sabdariffa]|uniref:Uncharacterized protein n=1 Tax=Hibiscus sabdariffa TaxID=183260 RepID=A0ABR2A5Z7_9ROSI